MEGSSTARTPHCLIFVLHLGFYKDRQTFPQALSLIPSLDVPWLEVRERCPSRLWSCRHRKGALCCQLLFNQAAFLPILTRWGDSCFWAWYGLWALPSIPEAPYFQSARASQMPPASLAKPMMRALPQASHSGPGSSTCKFQAILFPHTQIPHMCVSYNKVPFHNGTQGLFSPFPPPLSSDRATSPSSATPGNWSPIFLSARLSKTSLQIRLMLSQNILLDDGENHSLFKKLDYA